MTQEQESERIWPRWNSGTTALVLFVASLVVILEGTFHAFVVLDEFALTILRNTGLFSQRSAQGRAARPIGELCQAGNPRHAVILVPPARDLSMPGTCDGCPTPIPTAAESDLPFQVAASVYRMRPKVLALDLDLSQSPEFLQRADLLAAPNSTGWSEAATRLAFIVLPISGASTADKLKRQQRNDFARRVCASGKAALASAHVERSLRFGDVVQFHWQRLPEPESGPLPPVYPALGQVTRLLDDGLDTINDERGPGFMCKWLHRNPPPERIPFVDRPQTEFERAGELFEAAAYPGSWFNLKWINPAAARHDIAVFSVRHAQDLATLNGLDRDCLAKKVVFVGTGSSESAHDTFATVVGDLTPGVLVHAMGTVSAGKEIISKLSLSALVDLLIGFGVVALVRLLRRLLSRGLAFVFRAVNRDIDADPVDQSLAARTLLTATGALVPTAIAVGAALLCVVGFEIGWFFNPLIAFFGMWLHGVLEKFFEWPAAQAPLTVAPSGGGFRQMVGGWLLRLPQVRRSDKWPLKGLDALVYGGFACLYGSMLVWAFGILLSRVRVVLS